MLTSVQTGNVHLLPGIFLEREETNKTYLRELSIQGLLQNFYLEAGIVMPDLQILPDPENALLHWGWEAPICQLRGHFLGHFLSAAAMTVAVDGDRLLKAKLEDILDELEKCQKLNGGEWLAPIPEKYFDKLERNEYVWSPQYVMHKLILGLMHTYQYAHLSKALTLLDGLSAWYLRWTKKMEEVNPHAIYSGEEGGMLETWASLYELTGDEKYLTLAKSYANQSIFRKLESGKDPLTNSHANASIPHAHGAAKMYEITKDKRYLDIVLLFWKCAVKDRESYCTGGANAGEFWTPPHMLGQFMNERNQEFCTVYNMVRLADYLYRFTGEKEYADYIEINLYNGFLAQQNKATGMPTYFLPMKSGSRKKWGTKTRDFWCCHGTMVQAQTIYPGLCYYKDDSAKCLTIAQYIPSTLEDTLGGGRVTLSQSIDMKYYNAEAHFDDSDTSQMSRWLIKFTVTSEEKITLRFRLPSWLDETIQVTMDGEKYTLSSLIQNKKATVESGYLCIEDTFDGTNIQIYFPAGIRMQTLSDMPEKSAFMEGPIVLAGLCSEDNGLEITKESEKALLPLTEHTYESFPWMQSTYRAKTGTGELRFMPLYDITDETYTLYFTRLTR